MSQTPVHLRPKAKRTFHWEDTKAPAKPAGHRKRERTHEHRTYPHLRQIALALAFCLLTGCYAMMPPESAATSVLAAKKELPVYSVERDDHVIAVTFDASWGADNTPKLLIFWTSTTRNAPSSLWGCGWINIRIWCRPLWSAGTRSATTPPPIRT